MAGWKCMSITKHKISTILQGIKSYLPGLKNIGIRGTVMSGERLQARYYYSVWLRHLVMAHKNGIPIQVDSIAELGPGDSLGIGLSALLCGANKYYALDVQKYAESEYNLNIFYDLLDLFVRREKIPGTDEFPEIKPTLESHDFPSYILTDEILDISLKKDRIKSIESALTVLGESNDKKILISYVVPWNDSKLIKEKTIDLILSQAVLEHVDHISDVYCLLHSWLKIGGWMSHEIDFRSHGLSESWDGHWEYSNLEWSLIKGRRPYLINREPHSAHINYMQACGFDIICDIRTMYDSSLKREQLASKFKEIYDEDLTTATAFIQAIKI